MKQSNTGGFTMSSVVIKVISIYIKKTSIYIHIYIYIYRVVQAHFQISQPFHSTYLACFEVGCLCASLSRQNFIIYILFGKTQDFDISICHVLHILFIFIYFFTSNC